MARIKGRTREETRDSVLVAAEWAFANYGYDGSSLARIGARAGVTAAAICYHYGDKPGLRDAVLDAIYVRLTRLAVGLDDRATLSELVRVILGFAQENRDAMRLILRHITEGGGMDHRMREDRMNPLLGLLATRLARRFETTDANARRALVSCTHLLMRFTTNQPEDNRVALGLETQEEAEAQIAGILTSVARHLLFTPIEMEH